MLFSMVLYEGEKIMNNRFGIGLVLFLSMTMGLLLANITDIGTAQINDNQHTAWNLYQSDSNLVRRGMAAAYDSQRQVVVMFGGFDNQDNVDNETWEFDGTSWQQVIPVHSPSIRFWHSMTYDNQRHVVVLFGGRNEQGDYFNDTWEYDGVDWEQAAPLHAPVNRAGFGMTYDSCRQKVVLFGGGEFPQGTWEYDGTDWQEIAVSTHPEGLFLTAMTFDTIRCRVVLFGGDGGGAIGEDETWEYGGENWVLINTTTSPIARWGHALAFDPQRGKTVLFGGYGPQWGSGDALGDTWEYDGVNWVETSPAVSPAANEQQIMVYEGSLEKILLFGGFGSGETWLYGNEYSIYLPLVVKP